MGFRTYKLSQIFLLLMLMAVSLPLLANWKASREALQYVHQQGQFRFFYSLSGADALTRQQDINGNGIADMVENIALQTLVADKFFQRVLGLRSPLEMPRYQGKAKYIDIHIRDIKGNGSAGDAITRYNYRAKVKAGKSLSISIDNALPEGNLTPMHELFHIYQNGYTLFKNRWYTEGSARWLEFAFKHGRGKQNNLPKNLTQLERMLGRTYGAKTFWNRLLYLCSESGTFVLPPSLEKKSYLGSGALVIEGRDLHGYALMAEILTAFSRWDNKAAKDYKLSPYSWPEKVQKSAQNNRYLLEALAEVINSKACVQKPEIKTFVNLVYRYSRAEQVLSSGKDVSDLVEVLGTPLRYKYPDGAEIYARNVWDLQRYDGRIYIGGGNSSNSGPAPNAGPVPLISYDPQSQVFIKETQLDDEQIDQFRVMGQSLYIAGSDATESSRWGNFYHRSKASSWQKQRVLPGILHNYDLAYHQQRLIAAGSSRQGAAVVIDDPQHGWVVQSLGPTQRVFNLLQVGGQLYAVKQFLAEKNQKKLPGQYFSVAEFVQGSFKPRADIKAANMFPGNNVDINKTLRISRSEAVGQSTLFIGAYYYNRPFAVFVADSLAIGKLNVRQVKIDKRFTPQDILVRDSLSYILLSRPVAKGHQVMVMAVDNRNLTDPVALMHFHSDSFARSFEELNGDFYFGMGVNLKNQRNWKQSSLLAQTGALLRVKSSLIQ